MENWEIVSVESELDRLRNEREQKESLTGGNATGGQSKIGCLMAIVYFAAGLSLIRIIGEILSLFL